MKILLFIVAILAILNSCEKKEWKGWIYPNKHNLTNSKFIGIFNSLEECRESSINSLSKIHSTSSGDYECGLNCRSEYGLNICKKTLR